MTLLFIFFFKQKTAYEMRISDWSSDVCSSDLVASLRIQPDTHSPPLLPLVQLHRLLAADKHLLEGLHDEDLLLSAVLQAAEVWRCSRDRRRDCCRLPPHVAAAFLSVVLAPRRLPDHLARSEEHTSELQSLMRISYAVYCL